MSPGTARTMVQSLRLGQRGGRVRRNGVMEEVPLAHSWRSIHFAGGAAPAIAIPWGDLATAWFSTGIPNIETYVAVPRAAAIARPRSIGYGPYSHRHLGRCWYDDSPIAPADPPKNSYAMGDHVCGARCAMLEASDARRTWKLPTVIA